MRPLKPKTGFRVTEPVSEANAQMPEFTLGRYEGGYGPKPTRAVLDMAKFNARRYVEKYGCVGATKVLLWRETLLDNGSFRLEKVCEVKP